MKIVSSFWRFLTAVTALVVAVGVFGDGPSAQQAARARRDENFDIRSDAKSAGGAYLTRVAADLSIGASLADARAAGIARLKADRANAVDLENSPLTGTLEIVGAKPGTGFLTGPGEDRVAAMRGFLIQYADAYGLSLGQVQDLALVADYVNPAGNMAWVEFEQRINGIPVFQGLVRGGFTSTGELARITGPLASGLEAGSLAMSPALQAATAVALAAAHVGWNVSAGSLVQKAVDADGQRVTFDKGTMADDAKAWPVYFPLAPGVARLAWATEIWGDPDAFLVVVDAEDGTVLFRKNLTNYQTNSATYAIYNDDSPAPMSPSTVLPGSGLQAPFISRTTVTLIGNEAPNTFNNFGWMTDGTNFTKGNNVEAGVDLLAPDGVDATVTGVPNRTFNFAYDPQVDSPATATYRNGEVTDMFYWTNRYHDSLYLLGFTEAARNFQESNFGRGGAQLDHISAESQDSSGTNNANFATPVDGSRGRMQMYVFTGPNPDRTSALEHDVLLHELTHGTSNRLHNNASGLASVMSRGMGEGWSDFYARALLSSAAENVDSIYSTGGWVTNQISAGYVDNYYYGIRRFPYAVKTTVGGNGKPHNPLTLADIDPYQLNLSDGAFPCNPIFSCTTSAFEVHNIGEVWAMALFEVRARFITRLGWLAGNQRILQFVTDGMKLDPVSPTLLQARDSILAAAAAGGGTAADTADIWAGFATRGMGVLAAVNANTFVVAENFNVPGDVLPSIAINDVSVAEGNSGTSTAQFTVTLSNPGGMLTPARVTWTTADGTATAPGTTFTSAGGLTIPSAGAATPYPLTVNVAGLPASTTHVKVRLNSLSHTWPEDIDALLVSPTGQKVMLMSDAGAFSPGVSGLNLTFEDGAPKLPLVVNPTSGTYSPTDIQADALPAGAPAGPYSSTLSTFNGANPNGTWSLYVADDVGGDSGSLGSFSLIFSTPATDDYVPSSGTLVFPVGGSLTQTINVPIYGDPNVEPNETFVVNLSSPVSVSISDAQGTGTILNDEGQTSTAGDYDGDSKTDIGLYRPSTGTWYIKQSGANYSTFLSQTWGLSTDIPVPGDYDGDGKADFGLYRPSTGIWYILTSSSNYTTYLSPTWGISTDIPVADDYDGDGKTDLGLYRPSTGVWYVLLSSTSYATYMAQTWGISTDVPVTGDYDGDGKADFGLYRPSTGTWYVLKSSTNYATYDTHTWGISTDVAVPGDYDGDGKVDPAIYRPSTGTWYFLKSSTNYATYVAQAWGTSTDTPVPGDYDGDGRTDLGVFRPSTGEWYLLTSGSNYTTYILQTWGLSTDKPLFKRP